MIAAAAAGEHRAAAALDEVAKWTGVGLRAIVNIFNPQAIVMGGVLGPGLAGPARLVTASMAPAGRPRCWSRCGCMPAGLGEDSSLIGAAEMAFERLLADPLSVGQPAAHTA